MHGLSCSLTPSLCCVTWPLLFPGSLVRCSCCVTGFRPTRAVASCWWPRASGCHGRACRHSSPRASSRYPCRWEGPRTTSRGERGEGRRRGGGTEQEPGEERRGRRVNCGQERGGIGQPREEQYRVAFNTTASRLVAPLPASLVCVPSLPSPPSPLSLSCGTRI